MCPLPVQNVLMTSLLPSLELEPEESVIWTGQPLPAQVMRQSRPKGLFGLFYVAFTLIWMCGTVGGWNNKWDQGKAVAPFARHNVLIAATAGLCFLPPGIYMCVWPLLAWRQAKETEYIITDRRALIFKPVLFGGRRVLGFPPEALALIHYQEHEDGSGDIVFKNRKEWYGMHEPVGFMAIERVRDVVTLLRKLPPGGKVFERGTSGGSIRRAAENPAALSTLHVSPKTYSLPMSLQLAIALFGIGCSVVVLSLAFWAIVVPLGLLLGWSPSATAASVLAGPSLAAAVFLVPCAIMTHRVLAMPIKIAIHDDRTIALKSSFRRCSIPAAEIISIRTVGFGWMDPHNSYTQFRHKQGKIYLLSYYFPEFRDFLITVKSLNPAVEVSEF